MKVKWGKKGVAELCDCPTCKKGRKFFLVTDIQKGKGPNRRIVCMTHFKRSIGFKGISSILRVRYNEKLKLWTQSR